MTSLQWSDPVPVWEIDCPVAWCSDKQPGILKREEMILDLIGVIVPLLLFVQPLSGRPKNSSSAHTSSKSADHRTNWKWPYSAVQHIQVHNKKSFCSAVSPFASSLLLTSFVTPVLHKLVRPFSLITSLVTHSVARDENVGLADSSHTKHDFSCWLCECPHFLYF